MATEEEMNISEDREFERQFKKSMQVDRDALVRNILGETSNPPSLDEADPTALQHNPQLLEHYREKYPVFSIDPKVNDAMFLSAASTIGIDGVNSAIEHSALEKYGSTKLEKQESSKPQHHISKKQYLACQKFPALIEFLGGEEGEKIAKEIAAKVNEMLVVKLSENAKSLSKFAHSCKADKQNVKQFYIGENKEWVCQVTASGPFNGNEAIIYDKDTDSSLVVRQRNAEQWEDVSEQFNIIHEYAEQKCED